MANVTVSLTGDEARLLRSLDRVIAKEKKMGEAGQRAGKDSAKGSKTWEQQNQKVLGGIKQIAGALGITAGIGAAVQTIVRLTREWHEGMERIAKASAAAGKEMTALAMMQKGGAAAEAVRSGAAVGARYGMTPGQSWAALQQLQPQAGGLKGGLAALAAVGQFSQWAGVPVEEATPAISLAMGLKMDPFRGARALYAAGETSSLSPTEMATMAQRGLPGWLGMPGGPVMGLAVASQLSEVKKQRKVLGTSTEAARAMLLGAEAEKYFAGIGAPERDIIKRLKALRGKGITDVLALERAGFKEKLGQQAVNLLLQDIPGLERRYADISRMTDTPDLIATKRAGVEAVLPKARYQRISESLAAWAEQEKAIPTGRAAEVQRQAEAMMMYRWRATIAAQRAGYGAWVPEEGAMSEARIRRLQLMEMFTLKWLGGETAYEREFNAMIPEMNAVLSQPQEEAAANLREMARNSRGRPTLAAPDQDR